MKRFGIVLTSKNNYSMLEEWYGLHDYSDHIVINIDLHSSAEERKYGRGICDKNNIVFLECTSTEMQENILQASTYLHKKYSIDWLLYTHHDAYPLGKALQDLNDIILKSSKLSNFGVVGFNIYHDSDLTQWEDGIQKLMTTSRCPLELGNGYYNNRASSRVNYKEFKIKPFAVESVFWSTAMVNYSQYTKYINIDKRFNFFHAWDDIAFQFLYSDIYNIVIPSISFAHDQSLKTKHSLPASSPNGTKKEVEKMYGRSDHLKIWKDKWGFRYDTAKFIFGSSIFINKVVVTASDKLNTKVLNSLSTISRNDFKNTKHMGKKKSLMKDFFEHDPKNGPIKYFDILD